MPVIRKMESRKLRITPRMRVAAYARVSKDTEKLAHSLSAQISYYSTYIQSNPSWDYVGVYADYGISGTAQCGRNEFNRMITDCKEGKIDIILTKSISRFARNTVDFLTIVRQLKGWNIEVRFEKEHINTLDEDGEFMLTILSAFAQEEARSISRNVKWAIRKGFSEGKIHGVRIYGYRWNGTYYVIEQEEAQVVRLIYSNYLKSISAEKTKRQLDSIGVRAMNGGLFTVSVIREILSNSTYTGDVLLQKNFMTEIPEKKKVRNLGSLTQYLVQGAHEPIIDKATFTAVQMEIRRKREIGQLANTGVKLYCFSTRIRCERCGKNYTHTKRSCRKQEIWVCNSKRMYGAQTCDAKDIPDTQLKKAIAEALGMECFNEGEFLQRVDYLGIPDIGVIRIYMKDGSTIVKHWENTARKESATPEVRRARIFARMGRGKGSPHWLAGRLQCGICGRYYHRKKLRDTKAGVGRIYWKCPGCHKVTVYDDVIRALAGRAIEKQNFTDREFGEIVDCVTIRQDKTVEFHFYDGKTVTFLLEGC